MTGGADLRTGKGQVSKPKILLLLGIFVVAALAVSFGAYLPGIIMSPSGVLIEELEPFRVEFRPGEIVVSVLNTGPVDVTIGAVQVGGTNPFSMWDFFVEPTEHIPRLGTGTIHIPFRWIQGEPYTIKIITSSGATFLAEAAAAIAIPTTTAEILPTAIVLGTFVGVIPIFLGLAPFPLLRRLPNRWLDFLAALAAGVLAFLFVDTISEGVELASRLSLSLGPTLLIAGFAFGVFSLVLLGRVTIGRLGKSSAGNAKLYLAYMIAAAIGLHNLGEGLAIGAAQTGGKLALATLLAVGFALHNTTEGIAIASPMVRQRVTRISLHLVLMGLLAGVPTIFGTWLSLTFFSEALNTVFFAVAAGAILYVMAEIIIEIASKQGATNNPWLYGGLLVGFLVMYSTAVALTVLVGEI